MLTSFVDAIEYAADDGAARGYRVIRDSRWNESFLTFREVERVTRRLAGALQEFGLRKGDRVALILPEPDEFILTFLAAIRGGVVPVPIAPPLGLGELSGYVETTTHIVRRAGARMLILPRTLVGVLETIEASCPALVHMVSYQQLTQIDSVFRPVSVRGEDAAFLQFTSGSVSRPKGVILTHSNLLANCHNLATEAMNVDPDADSGVSWLPLYHDMGLIGFVLSALCSAATVTLLRPLMFLRRPVSWLQAISKYKATISFAPNFAYGLCLTRIRQSEFEGLDLTSWRVAGCGAEPIRAQVLEAFAGRFAPCGFRREALLAAYGLAESTLAVSCARGISTARVKASVLRSEGRAEPGSEDDDDVVGLVSCGKAFSEHEVAVFASDDASCDAPLPERIVGELCTRGPSVSPGYFGEPELTRKVFVKGWLRTGDLGYIADGSVYVCGRSKELIIVHGRNYYPQDIEWEASQALRAGTGHCVAFGFGGSGDDRERVVLAVETGSGDSEARTRMAAEMRARVRGTMGLVIDDIVFLAPGRLPKTSSGKLQRNKARTLYECGELPSRNTLSEVNRHRTVPATRPEPFEHAKPAATGDRTSAVPPPVEPRAEECLSAQGGSVYRGCERKSRRGGFAGG